MKGNLDLLLENGNGVSTVWVATDLAQVLDGQQANDQALLENHTSFAGLALDLEESGLFGKGDDLEHVQ